MNVEEMISALDHMDPESRRIAHRLLAKVEEDPHTGCLLWTRATGKGGYGNFYVRRGKYVNAHKAAYELFKGPVPKGLVLDHYVCDTKLCANPDHTRPATQLENTLRSDGPSALNAAKTRCMRGHEFTPENTYLGRGGRKRDCRACRLERRRARSLTAPLGAAA